ncbi:hypothetical protein [Nocardioides mangrovi]|uniref:Minor tail protein n=1 Tax=Nocardioides mangrovi TaxID=2874580 RepID=A0ABS7UFH9_9ACTN|nr:hypothetical protein [Nocardioides mangrovi]MBZ5739764.1 hypothetical protein [Nocardioides mangrovi]
MTVNYFMVTKGGEDLAAPGYLPLARGAGPATTAVADKRRTPFRTNLLPNPSWEPNTSGWSYRNVSTFARTNAQAAAGDYSVLLTKSSVGTDMGPVLSTPGSAVSVAVTDLALWFSARPVSTARSVKATVYAYDASDTLLSTTDYPLGSEVAGQWTTHADFVTVPSGTTKVGVDLLVVGAAAGEQHYFDDAWLVPAVAPSVTGVPADLSGVWSLWKDDNTLFSTPDRQTMVPPSGFQRSVFRAVRDPSIFTDDSANPLALQVYNHGWLLAERLAAYFQDTHEYDLTWDIAQDEITIVPVTGASVVNDGRGFHGFQTVTWPGSSVGVGTLRQLISGDEGSTRKVAAIIDLLAGLMTAGQINAIGDQYTANKTAILAAYGNLQSVAGAGLEEASMSAAQKQYQFRMPLNVKLALAARFLTQSKDGASPILNGITFAMQAITAKEAGLIGATFTTANYETMTDPIDNVLAMPSGY